MALNDEMRDAIFGEAKALGVDPLDIATTFSYETGGTFDPWKAGPTTKYGQHRGLIQWGEPQRKQYGITPDMSVTDQVKAAGQYLRAAGVKPGMGLMDIYSAVNAGRVGRYNASDAAAGGAPGTVADKVRNQMGAHRKKAAMLLGMDPGALGDIADSRGTYGLASNHPMRKGFDDAAPNDPRRLAIRGLISDLLEDIKTNHGDQLGLTKPQAPQEAQGPAAEPQQAEMTPDQQTVLQMLLQGSGGSLEA